MPIKIKFILVIYLVYIIIIVLVIIINILIMIWNLRVFNYVIKENEMTNS